MNIVQRCAEQKNDQSDSKWTGDVQKQCSPSAPIRACSDRMRVGAVSQHGEKAKTGFRSESLAAQTF